MQRYEHSRLAIGTLHVHPLHYNLHKVLLHCGHTHVCMYIRYTKCVSKTHPQMVLSKNQCETPSTNNTESLTQTFMHMHAITNCVIMCKCTYNIHVHVHLYCITFYYLTDTCAILGLTPKSYNPVFISYHSSIVYIGMAEPPTS